MQHITTQVVIDRDGLSIPRELDDFIGAPRLVELRFVGDALYLINDTAQFLSGVRQKARQLLKRNRMVHADRETAGEWQVRYRFRAGEGLPDVGSYQVVNYHHLLLMPVQQQEEVSSRNVFWSQISDYHEHRVAEKQDESALMVSKWLADLLAQQYRPDSVLEVGCGAGRNLLALSERMPEAKVAGIEINPAAVGVAIERLQGAAEVRQGNLYADLSRFEDGSFDVVFSCGVLMHVPHANLYGVLSQMHRIARKAVLHFELHGPSHAFDFHRYPRNYREAYLHSGIAARLSYEIFDPSDFRGKGTSSYRHALLVANKI